MKFLYTILFLCLCIGLSAQYSDQRYSLDLDYLINGKEDEAYKQLYFKLRKSLEDHFNFSEKSNFSLHYHITVHAEKKIEGMETLALSKGLVTLKVVDKYSNDEESYVYSSTIHKSSKSTLAQQLVDHFFNETTNTQEFMNFLKTFISVQLDKNCKEMLMDAKHFGDQNQYVEANSLLLNLIPSELCGSEAMALKMMIDQKGSEKNIQKIEQINSHTIESDSSKTVIESYSKNTIDSSEGNEVLTTNEDHRSVTNTKEIENTQGENTVVEKDTFKLDQETKRKILNYGLIILIIVIALGIIRYLITF